MFAWLAETGGAAESITTQQCVDGAIANPDELGDLVFSHKLLPGYAHSVKSVEYAERMLIEKRLDIY